MMDNTTNGSIQHEIYTEAMAVYSVKSLIIILIMICTVVGNFISIAVILRTRSMRTPSGNFVISLAVADLILGAFVVPFSFAAAVKGKWTFPDSGKLFCLEDCLVNVLAFNKNINNCVNKQQLKLT